MYVYRHIAVLSTYYLFISTYTLFLLTIYLLQSGEQCCPEGENWVNTSDIIIIAVVLFTFIAVW